MCCWEPRFQGIVGDLRDAPVHGWGAEHRYYAAGNASRKGKSKFTVELYLSQQLSTRGLPKGVHLPRVNRLENALG